MQAINNALSGLNAAATRLAVAADNVANQSTPNYTQKDAVQSARPEGGVKVDVRNSAAVGGVDEATQVVNAATATYNFKANLSVIKAENKLSQDLLDIKA
ncbi:MAG: flagellar basal body rod protein [Alphaproteobacteria bacterium]|nr:flagellar basal body rod protein [Alphaproteobacteria bacterium]